MIKLKLPKILDEDYNDFSKNDTIENNDHFNKFIDF